MSETAQYLSQIKRAYARADATEHTYRPYLQDLLESILSGYKATNEAKRKVYGAPDFIVSKGSLDVGHLEVKDVGVNLDKVLKTDQWQRYTNALGSLILSDYLEFRWYVRGKLRRTVRIADLFEKTITPKANAHEELAGLLQAFVQNPTPGCWQRQRTGDAFSLLRSANTGCDSSGIA